MRALARGIGRTNTTSTSNTKKIITTIKNFREKDDRALDLASNPHSNAVNPSWSEQLFLLPQTIINPKANGIKQATAKTKYHISIQILGSTC
jgi:hypothetical protein